MIAILIAISSVALIVGAARLIANAANHIHVTDFERTILAERRRATVQLRDSRRLGEPV